MKVFRGWYRRFMANKDMVWHRVYKVDSILAHGQMAHTVCGKNISTTKCDFEMKPDHKCMRCEKSPNPSMIGMFDPIVEKGRGFVPIGAKVINTKVDAIHELKRLLKPRIYYFKIWGDKGICITAKWESAMNIDIYTKTKIITKRRKNKVMGLSQIQADLGRFKSAVDCLVDAITVLAKKDKMKRKLNGRLTENEDRTYFDELFFEAEK